MTTDERTRHEMYLGLEEKLGTTVADAFMGYLPPVGWADVATKHDLAALESRIELRFAALEERIDSRIDAATVRLLLWLFPTQLTMLGLVFAIAKFA